MTTEMRIRYLATELGGQLRADTDGGFSIVQAHDHALAIGPNATLAEVAAYCSAVDPAIAQIGEKNK